VNDWLHGIAVYDQWASEEFFIVTDSLRTTPVAYFAGFGIAAGANITPNLAADCTDPDNGSIGYQQHNPDSHWYHLAPATIGLQLIRYQFDVASSTGRLWRNSTLLGSALYLAPSAACNQAGLAARHDGTNYWHNMRYYELRRYAQSLSPDQAAAVAAELSARYGIG
jgi:hypothetical protein